MKKKLSKHTKESCQNVAMQYKTRFEFKKGNPNVYNSARHNGWFDEITSHMPLNIQKLYDTPEKIISYIEKLDPNNKTLYRDLPAGLIKQAKKFNLTDFVKSKVLVGIQEEKKFRPSASPDRPNNMKEWSEKLKPYILNVISSDILLGSPDKRNRIYKSLELQCEHFFECNNEKHPSFIRRITNIERDLKENKLNCPYCESPNLVSKEGDKNRSQDIKRLNEKLSSWAESIEAILQPNQITDKSEKKYLFIHKITGEIRSISGKSILAGRIIDPFTRGSRLNDKFRIPFDKVKAICEKKGFNLLTTEIQYLELTAYSKDHYSPSTRSIEFEYWENVYSYPIGTVIKDLWYPKDYTISEEITRYCFQRFFKFEFEFKKCRPKELRNENGNQLELDGYCENVYGKKIAFEHQGKQHYSGTFNGKKIENIFSNDAVKKEWCLRNGIILIEIQEIGNKIKIDQISDYIHNSLIENKLYFTGNKINNSKVTLDELSEYVGQKIPNRIKKIQSKLKNHNIKILFKGINKNLGIKVVLENQYELKKQFHIGAIEKWSENELANFSNILK